VQCPLSTHCGHSPRGYHWSVSERRDTSLEAQVRRNRNEGLKSAAGCQLAGGIVGLASLVPLGILYPFTDSLAALDFAILIFNVGLAMFAYRYRRNAEPQSLWRVTAGWVTIVATGFALLFLVHGLSMTFGA
jgi:hypothetical protein